MRGGRHTWLRAVFAAALAGAVALAQGTSAQGRTSAQASRSQWSGVYTEAQAARGAPLYAENCAFCHGPALEGTISAPALTGPVLVTRWNNRSLGDLLQYIQEFMPWNSPGGLSRQQNADIMAFMLRQSHYAAGREELPAQAEAQREIGIVATKP